VETRSEVANPQGQQECLLRVLLVTKQDIGDMAPAAVAEVSKAFDLDLAQEYASSCNRGAGNLPETTGGVRTHFFCNGQKIVLSWSQDKRSPTKNAICIADEAKIQMMRESLDCGFVQVLASHEMVVGLVGAVVMFREIDSALNAVKHKVREVEIRTGYHEWQTRRENPALGDLESLSAKMSGCEIRCATLIRKIEVLRQLTSFISQQLAETRSKVGHDDSGMQEQFESNLDTLIRRTNIQHLEANVFTVRTKTQLTAVS